MADTNGLITLKDVVVNTMMDLGPEAQKAEYFRFMQWAIRGFGELKQFHLNYVKEVTLDITDINTVILPPDYVNFVSIGIGINGRMWTFTKDNTIISPEGESCGAEAFTDENGEGVSIGDGGYVSGYGVPGGRNMAYYKLDLQNNRIILDQNLSRTSVKLKYITSGINLDGPTYIPLMARECLIAWVHWKRVQHNRNYTRGEKDDAKMDYYEEVEKLRDLTGPTLEQIYDAIAETWIQTAKR
jgi:hypothetical protein